MRCHLKLEIGFLSRNPCAGDGANKFGTTHAMGFRHDLPGTLENDCEIPNKIKEVETGCDG